MSQLPFTLPVRGNTARLPLALLPFLAVAAAIQLAIPGHIDLPTGGVPARLGQSPPAPLPLVVLVPAAMIARDPFAPVSGKAGPAGAASAPPPDPLRGAVISGVVQRGRLRAGVVLLPDGTVRDLPIGGTLAGWRLDALTPAGARLTRGRHRILLAAYGAHTTPPPRPGTPGKTADDQ